MSPTEIIDQTQTLPLKEQKAVLKVLSAGLGEALDARLYDERSKEPDGRILAAIVTGLKQAP